ncbi:MULTISPECIES: hypothetical protein [unclassified Methanoculleus]|jgi:predicted nucleic acid-binding Zn ribbon protein|uniref:Uncharacterized protein n=1 Tax=Methanoculleus palmolei TaxID=72612 RepID=A0ABD8AAI2_9EURY|nr:hypothetical protein [Methanoculleus sp. UBA377]MDD2472837.1 hypothetical protein [Methanoculleus sp.]WOX56541.1 hypothetical protein R6Y95_04200 [Methanoculleus palmolei]
MKQWSFTLAALLLLAALPAAASAAPPAHNYDCSDTTPTAYDARVDQAAMSYSSSSSTNAVASTAYNQFRSDAIFFFNGHGLYYDDSHKGGGIKFSSESWILADTDGHYPGNYQYYISDYGTDIRDVLLAVYLACYSSHDNPYNGDLVRETVTNKGADICVGFDGEVEIETGNYWSESFWNRVRNGETVASATSNAKDDCYWQWPIGYHGVDTYEISGSYNSYLTPARHGVS